MDEQQQKVRLIIIAISGVLLLGGVGGWLMFGSKTDEVDDAAMTNTAAPATPATPTSATADPNAVATTAGAPATPADPSAPAPASTPDNTAATPPAPANANPVATAPVQPVATSTPPPVAANPPAAKPPATPPATTPIASKPATTPPAPVSTPAVAEQTLIASNNAATTPVGDSNPVAAAPAPKNQFPATKRDEASAEARQVAGRKDPMQPTAERASFPMWSKGIANSSADAGDKPADIKVPPPPPEEKVASGTKEKLMPPPPPPPSGNETAVGIPGGVDPGMLPMPPEKPTHAQFLKLTAIVGNKAVLSVPPNIRSVTKWPATICLGPGERIEDSNNAALSIVSVDPDSVTIDEDGERSVKSLPTIK